MAGIKSGKQFQLRVPEGFLERVDDWRRAQPDLPTRSEALRRLVELALEAERKAKRKGKPH